MPKASIGNYFGGCLLCREMVHGEAVILGFEALCLSCGEGVASAVRGPKQGTDAAEDGTDATLGSDGADAVLSPAAEDASPVRRVCKKCGERFDNVGRFMAHAKRCEGAGAVR